MVEIKVLERRLKALANRRRLEIVRSLKSARKLSVGAIAFKLRLSFAATSRHLILLESADVLKKEQIGLTVYYSLERDANEPVSAVVAAL